MICSKCRIDKSVDEFAIRKDSLGKPLRRQCKQCIANRNRTRYESKREEILTQKKEYWEENKELLKAKSKKSYYVNQKSRLEYSKKYYYENWERINNNPQKKASQKEWNRKNVDRIRNKKNKRRRVLRIASIDYKLKENISRRIRKSIKGILYCSTMEFLGYAIEQLKEHLQNQFSNEMTFENYGKYWHIDHIIPQCLFDFSKVEEITKCWSLRNLRPLVGKDNIRKNSKLDFNLVEEYKIQDLLPGRVMLS